MFLNFDLFSLPLLRQTKYYPALLLLPLPVVPRKWEEEAARNRSGAASGAAAAAGGRVGGEGCRNAGRPSSAAMESLDSLLILISQVNHQFVVTD